MSRDDGFTVMDVSVDLMNDPKVRKLWRFAPDHAGAAFAAFMATLGSSWSHGRRVSIDDAWPAHIPFSKAAVEALVHVGLLDRRGFVSVKAWRGWFEPARERREIARAKWKRANDKRRKDADKNGDDTGVAPESPRGNNADTPATVPYRSSPSVPPEGSTRTLSDIDPRARGPVLVHPERTA